MTDHTDTTVAPAPTDDPTWQMLNDWFVTALEGGIGYWSSCRLYRWDRLHFVAVVVDCEEEAPRTEHRIDRAVIERGLKLYRDGYHVDGYGDRIFHAPAAARESIDSLGEEGDYDAGDADTVVQLGLFGKVVYG